MKYRLSILCDRPSQQAVDNAIEQHRLNAQAIAQSDEEGNVIIVQPKNITPLAEKLKQRQQQQSPLRSLTYRKLWKLLRFWQRKGRVEGQSNTILRLLNRKLGSLDAKAIEQIRSLSTTQLDSLTEDLLDFQSVDDLNNWLNNL